jgi:polyisoprenoid-binding protein YceI
MKTIASFILIAIIACLPVFSLAQTSWKVKEDAAEVKFSGSVSGSFKGLKADIIFDPRHLEQATFSAAIDATSIATGFFLKNTHAKNALGADNYPAIKFTSVTVTKSAEAYNANGLLTMKGTTKPATIHFTFTNNGNEGIFQGTFKVIPKDFGVTRSGTPDEVSVSLLVPVVKVN